MVSEQQEHPVADAIRVLALRVQEERRRGDSHFASWRRELDYIDELEKENKGLREQMAILRDQMADLEIEIAMLTDEDAWEADTELEVADGT